MFLLTIVTDTTIATDAITIMPSILLLLLVLLIKHNTIKDTN